MAAHLKWAKKGLGNTREKKRNVEKKPKWNERIEVQLEITHSILVSNPWIKLLDFFFHKVQWMEVFLFFKSKKKFSTFDEGFTKVHIPYYTQTKKCGTVAIKVRGILYKCYHAMAIRNQIGI